MRSVPVFVSSTFVDLQAHRAAVRDVLIRLKAAVSGMAYFGALPETPKEECLRILRGCHFYVGIIAMRYGSLDPETGKSFTHLEYEEAQRLRLPSLIYLLDEERHQVLPRNVDFGERAEKLHQFKVALRASHVVGQFKSPEDLAMRVAQDLPALVERSGTFVHRGELVRLAESLPRVDWLTAERFEFLKKVAGDAASPIPSDDVLRECLEFLLAGDRLAAVFLLARAAKLDLREATDTLMEVEKRIAAVLSRAKVQQDQGSADGNE